MTSTPPVDEKRGRRRLGCTLVALAMGLLLPELILRHLLFSEGAWAQEAGQDLRDPGLFADPRFDDEYWRMRWVVMGERNASQAPPVHPRVGWLSNKLDPATLRPRLAPDLKGRRPILLYGASFAEGVLPPVKCLEGVVATSDLNATHVLLNYGAGGYGLDQMLLLMRETLPLYEGLNPIVVVMPVVDSDLARCSLAFRSGPKPSFRLEQDALVLNDHDFSRGADAFIEQYGIGITSYAWNYLLYAKSQVPRGWQAALRDVPGQQQEQATLVNAVLDAIQLEATSRDFEFFFLLCTSPRGLPPHEFPGVERRIRRRFKKRKTPVVYARSHVMAALGESGTLMSDLFIEEGPKKNHPTLRGNQVLLEALREGLAGRFAD